MPIKDSVLRDSIMDNNLAEFKQLMDQKITEYGRDALYKELSDSEKELGDDFGITPFACAAKYDALEICNYLLNEGVDPALPNPSTLARGEFKGHTPLELACYWGAWSSVRFLIETCRVTVTQDALVCAVESEEGNNEDRKNIIKCLLQHGASPWGFNKDQKTIFMIWADGGYGINNISLLEVVMTELGIIMDYNRQVAFRGENDEIEYGLPFLADLFLSLKHCKKAIPEDAETRVESMKKMLGEKKLDPTQPIKFGLYQDLSPLDLLVDQIIAKKGFPDLFKKAVDQILTVCPHLVLHPIRLDKKDEKPLSVLQHLYNAGEPYRQTLKKALVKLTDEQLAQQAFSLQGIILEMIPEDRRVTYLDYFTNRIKHEGKDLQKYDALMTEKPLTGKHTRDENKSDKKESKISKSDVETVTIFGINASALPSVPVALPAAAKLPTRSPQNR